MEHLPAEVLHQILASLPASSVAAAAVTHPALAAAARALPELSHVHLRLTLQRGVSSQPETQGNEHPSTSGGSSEQARPGVDAALQAYEASVQSFFARPGAPGVHHLHIEARYDPCDTPHETWTDPWRQITAPRLEWLAPALRTARSLRLTLVELMALGYCATHGIATEVLHIDSTWRLHVYDLQWWNRPPCRSLPVSVRRLIMETTCEVGLFTYGFHNYEYAAQCGPKEWGAPELHNLQHLMLRAPQVQIDSLYAFGAQLPERLTLQAKSHINVRGGCAGEVVRKVRQLAANGHRIELCCPTRDCIRSWSEDSPDWNPSEAIKQQEDEHLKELRLWFVETAPDPDPEWCSPHIVRDSYRKPASGICRMG